MISKGETMFAKIRVIDDATAYTNKGDPINLKGNIYTALLSEDKDSCAFYYDVKYSIVIYSPNFSILEYLEIKSTEKSEPKEDLPVSRKIGLSEMFGQELKSLSVEFK